MTKRENLIQKLNAERNKVLQRYIILLVVTGITGISLAKFEPIAGLIVAALMYTFGGLCIGIYGYKAHFKTKLLTTLFNDNFENCKFNFDDVDNEDQFFQLGLIPHANDYHADDLISGDYRGIHFKRCDVRLHDLIGIGDHREDSNIFTGQWICYSLPYKKFKSKTRVIPNGLFKASDPGRFLDEENLDRLETESSSFNEFYSIFTTNSEDAFYLLTPQMMERIIKLDCKYEDIRIAFINSKMHILIESNENMFEPSILDSVNENLIRTLEKQIDIIKDIADILKLEGKEKFIVEDNISEFEPNETANESDEVLKNAKTS